MSVVRKATELKYANLGKEEKVKRLANWKAVVKNLSIQFLQGRERGKDSERESP